MSIRRAVRAGTADGALIEDGGVAGQSYSMTKNDLFRKNRDLIEQCARILAAQPWTRMNVKRTASGLAVETVGLDQLDIFVSGRPAGRPHRVKSDGKHKFKLRAKTTDVVEIVGYADDNVRQRRRIFGS
jgi:hypothetical protein